MRTGHVAAVSTAVLFLTAGLSAQAPATAPAGYLTPPKAIVDILDAAPLPNVVVSPDHEVMALLPRRSMPPIAEVSQPMLRLAGIRINPRTNGPHRVTHPSTGITLRSTTGGTERKVAVPAGARMSGLLFAEWETVRVHEYARQRHRSLRGRRRHRTGAARSRRCDERPRRRM